MLINLFNFKISKLAHIDHMSKIQKHTKIYRGCKVVNSQIDSFTYIAPNSYIVNSKIGKFCSISQYVYIGLPNHKMDSLSTSPIFYSKHNALDIRWTENNLGVEISDVEIGSDVWIGRNSLIRAGVVIGNGAIVGAGSIVTKDVPAYSIVAGVPARIIRYRFSNDIIEKLLEIEWWNYSEDILKRNLDSFENPSVEKLNVFERKLKYEI